VIDFELFRDELEAALARSDRTKGGRSTAGASTGCRRMRSPAPASPTPPRTTSSSSA
jgi:hypothetical protein